MGAMPTVDSATFRSVLGHFCSGIVVVTSGVDARPVGLTAQSFTSLSLDPPLVLFCAARTSATWPLVRASGQYCVNVLGEDQAEVCRRFSVPGADKFAGVDWGWSPDGLPVIAGCIAYVECTLEHVYDGGDHEIAVGRVRDLRLGESAGPLVFFQGAYRQLLHVDEQ